MKKVSTPLTPGDESADAVTLPDAALSQPEIQVAIARLTDGEKTALMKIARLYSRKTPHDAQDLV
jgi:hypothetical protein